MNDPQLNHHYKAHIILSVEFDDIEFLSSVKYDFETDKSYDWRDDELENIAIDNFMDEHQSLFVDVDVRIKSCNVTKN